MIMKKFLSILIFATIAALGFSQAIDSKMFGKFQKINSDAIITIDVDLDGDMDLEIISQQQKLEYEGKYTLNPETNSLNFTSYIQELTTYSLIKQENSYMTYLNITLTFIFNEDGSVQIECSDKDLEILNGVYTKYPD